VYVWVRCCEAGAASRCKALKEGVVKECVRMCKSSMVWVPHMTCLGECVCG